MNDLMKRMDSFKKELFERKHSLTRISESNHAASTSSLLNVRSKKNGPVKLLNKFKSPKALNKSTYNRDWLYLRTYKLDAVKLLDSRVKQFMAKHMRIWRMNTHIKIDKGRFLSANASEDNSAIRVSPIVEIYQAEQKMQQTTRRRMTHMPFKAPLLKGHRMKQDFSKGLKRLKKTLLKAMGRHKAKGFRSINSYVCTSQFSEILAKVMTKVAFRKLQEQKPMTQTVNLLRTIKDKSSFSRDKNLLKSVKLSDVLSEIYLKNFKFFFKKSRKLLENDQIRGIVRNEKLAKGVKRLNNYFRASLSKAFYNWERNSRKSIRAPSGNPQGSIKLPMVLARIFKNRELLAAERFWWKSLMFTQEKKRVISNLKYVLHRKLRYIYRRLAN